MLEEDFKMMSFYKEPFLLEGPCGNNALSFEERRRAAGGREPSLYVPSLIDGSFDDLREGSEVCFEDFDENGELISARGLEHFVRMDKWVVVDNHNHVLYFWYEALAKGILKPGAKLIHVDQHKDMRRPETMLKSAEPEEVFRYTNYEVNVGNYIVPAMEQGLIGEVLSVTSEAELEDERFMDEGNKILNIDLDFFAPEMDYIDFEKAAKFIQRHAEGAALVTVATSPFFIEQELALEKLKRLLR